jgi:recombination associated protein RdgC
MWFRALRLWQLRAPWTLSDEEFDQALASQPFTPCGPGQTERSGWAPLLEEEDGAHVLGQGPFQLCRLRTQERILPKAAIMECYPERAAAQEAKTGIPVKGMARRELIETLTSELLSQALVRSRRTWVLIDRDRGLLATEGSVAAKAEAVLESLRGALGTLPIAPLRFENPLDGVLTRWLMGDPLPAGFSLGQWADLEHPLDRANKVRFRGQDLDEAEVHATLERGLRVTALELHYQLTDDAAVSFVLDEEGVIKRLRLPEANDDTPAEDAAAALDANLALLAPTLGKLIDALLPALGGLQKDDTDG